jgi:nitroimidazol reductase NimA-like FMN-containing flavoprotein (pyridoxamine 5'-phosphate oxidase superfamily)
LRSGEYGVLSTVSEDGQPYGVPVNYCYASGSIFFHCAPEGHKLDNLAAEARVSFCVVGKTELMPAEFGTKYESAIVFGRAVEVLGPAKQEAFAEILKKYSAGFEKEGLVYTEQAGAKTRLFRIEIESLAGKARR